MPKLKPLPCPLCGLPVEQPMNVGGKHYHSWNIGCDVCGLVLFGDRETKQGIIAKWNQRNRKRKDATLTNSSDA